MDENLVREIEKSDFPVLKSFLESSLPSSVTILAILEIEEKFNFGRTIFVSRHDPTLFVFGEKIVSSPPSFSIFWDKEHVSTEQLKQYLLSVPDWNWNQRFVFSSLDSDLAEQLDELIMSGNLSCEKLKRKYSSPCFIMKLDESKLPDLRIHDGFKSGELSPHHVPYLLKNWKFSKGESIEEYQDCLKIFPSSAVYKNGDSDKDNPVSWVYFFNNGFMGMTFTHPEYRKMGLASSAVISLCKKLMEFDIPKLVQVEVHNQPSLLMHKRIGFELYSNVCWNEYYPSSE